MPTITFTHSEITGAFPHDFDGGVGSASAWEIYDINGADAAAATIRATLYKVLLLPIFFRAGNLSLDDIGLELHCEVMKDLQFTHGDTFGWSDSTCLRITQNMVKRLI